MADKENNTEETEDKVKPKINFGKLLMPMLVFLNVAAMGGGLFLVYISTIGYEETLKSEADFERELASYRNELSKETELFTFKDFNANLDGLPKRFIRLKVSVEMLTRGGLEEVTDLGPGVRDRIMKLIGSKSFYTLEGVQGKLELKNQIRAEVNSFLSEAVVKNVYFSTFAIQ